MTMYLYSARVIHMQLEMEVKFFTQWLWLDDADDLVPQPRFFQIGQK